MKAGYLRTNYRRSMQARLTGIGGGWPLSSQYGGAGTADPYGGFIWLSWTGTTVDCTTGASLAGISSRVVDSTFGIMQSYYGNGQYSAGYAFQPVFVHILCFTDREMSEGGHVDAADASLGFWPQAVSLRHSGSYWMFTPLMLRLATASTATWVSLSMATVTAQVGGFIISGPG